MNSMWIWGPVFFAIGFVVAMIVLKVLSSKGAGLSRAECMEIAKIMIICVTALIGWATLLHQQSTRYDASKHEVYRRRIEAYERLAGVMYRFECSAAKVARKEEAGLRDMIEAGDSLNRLLPEITILMPQSVIDEVSIFSQVRLDALKDAAAQATSQHTPLVAYREPLAKASDACRRAMRESLDIEDADIDFAKWRR